MRLRNRLTGDVVDAESEGSRIMLLMGGDRIPLSLLDAPAFEVVGALEGEVDEAVRLGYALEEAMAVA